jgi:hypothetical protein
MHMGYNDFDDYDDEEDEDLAALFVLGDLYDDEIDRNKNSGGGCLTTILVFMMIPTILAIITMLKT